MIDIVKVRKLYGKKPNQYTALHDVNLKIPDGKIVAILGKSGSGKSTLMHIMSGLDTPQSGKIIVDGQDILELNRREVDEFRAKKIGFIFQSFFVQANETAIDNVSLPLEIARVPKKEQEARVTSALKAVALYDKRNNKAKDLSGGQKQRLAVARAIVNGPEIIFADEPTGNLDSETGARIEKLLFNYSRLKGTTLVIVTHDTELAAKCDMQVLVKDGRIEKVLHRREKKSVR